MLSSTLRRSVSWHWPRRLCQLLRRRSGLWFRCKVLLHLHRSWPEHLHQRRQLHGAGNRPRSWPAGSTGDLLLRGAAAGSRRRACAGHAAPDRCGAHHRPSPLPGCEQHVRRGERAGRLLPDGQERHQPGRCATPGQHVRQLVNSRFHFRHSLILPPPSLPPLVSMSNSSLRAPQPSRLQKPAKAALWCAPAQACVMPLRRPPQVLPRCTQCSPACHLGSTSAPRSIAADA